MVQTLVKRPTRTTAFSEDRAFITKTDKYSALRPSPRIESHPAMLADSSAEQLARSVRPIAAETAAQPQQPATMIATRPSPTFAAPVMAEPIAALPQEELITVRAQRPMPLTQADIARDNLEQQQARVMVDKDKNPILNALKGFGIRFLQTKGGLMERIGGGAFGAIENTLIPDSQGARGTVDERFMQAGRINQAQGAYDTAAQLEKDQIERETRAADLQNKVLRPFIDTEKIRTKDDATEERARAAQARIDLALTKLGLETKPIASEGKMWVVANVPDGKGGFTKSLKPLLDPDNPQNQLDDPKAAIAAENNATRQTIASGRNATTIEAANIRAGATKYSADSNAQIKREQLGAQLKNQLATRKITIAGLKAKLDSAVSEGKLTQSQADAAYADATSPNVVSNPGQAARTIESIRRQGREKGKTAAEIEAKVQEFINSLPAAIRPK